MSSVTPSPAKREAPSAVRVAQNAELLQEYTLHLHERALSANTVLAYLSDLHQFAEILSQRETILFTASKADVAHFLQHLTQHDIGPRSRARKIAALRRFYRWLLLNERLEKDPTVLSKAPRLPRLLPRPIEPHAMHDLLQRVELRACAEDHDVLELRDHAILETLYGGGLRVSELCAMRQADLQLEAGTVRVRGKGNKERIVPLGAKSIAAIGEYLHSGRPVLLKAGRGKGPIKALFLSEQGTGITRRRVHQIVRRLGGEHVHPHRLRHSCCTDMLRNGADLRSVQEMAGHANLGTTQIYTKVTPDHLQDAHKQFHPRG